MKFISLMKKVSEKKLKTKINFQIKKLIIKLTELINKHVSHEKDHLGYAQVLPTC